MEVLYSVSRFFTCQHAGARPSNWPPLRVPKVKNAESVPSVSRARSPTCLELLERTISRSLQHEQNARSRTLKYVWAGSPSKGWSDPTCCLLLSRTLSKRLPQALTFASRALHASMTKVHNQSTPERSCLVSNREIQNTYCMAIGLLVFSWFTKESVKPRKAI